MYTSVTPTNSDLLKKHPGHHCDSSNCKRIIVLDGNMKNHRDICAARLAGYAEYEGLPGRITTGCTNTPQLKSRYCVVHATTGFSSAGEDRECSQIHQTGLDQVPFIKRRQLAKIHFIRFVSSTLSLRCLLPSSNIRLQE